MAECPHDNPLIHELLEKKHKGALKISDFVSDSDFRRTRMYNDFLIDVEGAHMMGLVLPISPEMTISCAINRGRLDFSERDRTLLTLLEPHLISAVRNSLEYSRLCEKEILLESLLERVTRARLVVDGDGNVLFDSGGGARLLREHSEDGGYESAGQLPLAVRAWLRARLSESPLYDKPTDMTLDGAERTLKIALVPDSASGRHNLILRERQKLSPRLLHSLNLTQRESEVLYWISEGKTDEVIAVLLSISTRTVHKHIEHIFRKLGVETRTGAVRCAIDLLEAAEL
ncbi:MAG: helix-turn-helix transcriptional regulator [Chloracidobacterium sp.]|nr:helix-turn-helix transcriptional regulator [Chloracidobacterium sp.]